MELGDAQVAVDLGPRVDASRLPIERRVRHAIETARVYSARNRRDDVLDVMLEAEQLALEQIKHHALSRQGNGSGNETVITRDVRGCWSTPM